MKPIHYLVIILVAVIIAMILLWPASESEKIKDLEQKVVARETLIHQLSRDYTKIQADRAQDSVKRAIEASEHRTKVKNLTRQIANLRANPRVVEILEKDTLVLNLVTAQDSLLRVQSDRIARDSVFIHDLQESCAQAEANFDERMKLHEQSLADQKEITADYRKEIRKHRRLKRLAIITGIITTVGALFVQ